MSLNAVGWVGKALPLALPFPVDERKLPHLPPEVLNQDTFTCTTRLTFVFVDDNKNKNHVFLQNICSSLSDSTQTLNH